MLNRKSKFSDIDNELAQFARLFALPVRVYIIRTIIEHGNAVSRQDLCNVQFEMDNILKHLSELRSLGMIKVSGTKEKTIYSINSDTFEQISTKFMALFNHVEPTNPEQSATKEEELVSVNADTLRYLNFGVFIKKHRTELHLSQDDLARKLGMDRAELSRVECGKKIFNAGKLWALSKALYLDYNNLSKEYYSYQIADLVEKSGLSDVMLESMMNRQLYSTTR